MKARKLMLPLAVMFCVLFLGVAKAMPLLHKSVFITNQAVNISHPLWQPSSLQRYQLIQNSTTGTVPVFFSQPSYQTYNNWEITFTGENGAPNYDFITENYVDNNGTWDFGSIDAGTYTVTISNLTQPSSSTYLLCDVDFQYTDSSNNYQEDFVSDVDSYDNPVTFSDLDIAGEVDITGSTHN